MLEGETATALGLGNYIAHSDENIEINLTPCGDFWVLTLLNVRIMREFVIVGCLGD